MPSLRLMPLLEALAEQLQRSTSELRKQLASSRFISVEVADAAAAQDAIDRLTQLPGVETAYVKPPDEPA